MYSFRCGPRAAMAAAFLSMVCTAAAPPGWFLAGNRPQDYKTGVDAQASYAGQPSAYLKSTKPQIDGFGTLMQQFNADDYLGKRIRFSAFVKTDAVAGWCALWTRVDKGTQSVAFDNMQDRAIKGTTAWQTYEIVLDVAPDATGIAFGILIDGTGTAWMSGAKLDVVGTNVPTTGPSMAAQQGPQNLALEATAAGKPRAWFLAGSKPRSYSVAVESGSGAYLKSTDLEIDGFGTLMQGLSGERLRRQTDPFQRLGEDR